MPEFGAPFAFDRSGLRMIIAPNLAINGEGAQAMEHVVNMHEAKSQLSKLVALAQQGDAVTIAIHGKPVAKPLPIKPRPVFGLGKDQCPPVA